MYLPSHALRYPSTHPSVHAKVREATAHRTFATNTGIQLIPNSTVWAGVFPSKNHKEEQIVTCYLFLPLFHVFHAEFKPSYVRNRSIRSVPVQLDGDAYKLALEDEYQPILPRNSTKQHKVQRAVLHEEEDRDMGEYSGTGSIAEYTAPNLIKVTHR